MKKRLTLLIALLVVTTAVTRAQVIDRTSWTVTTETDTGYGHVPDKETGLPKDMFDGELATFLSLVKPGKSYSPVPTQSSLFLPSFTVDMKSPQTFDYMRWNHRTGNSYNYIRVYGVDIFGSNDGAEFTQINTDGIVWIPNIGGYSGTVTGVDSTTYAIEIPESTYRYFKVQYVKWSDNYVGGEHPDYATDGAKSGSTMQIGEFGLGKKTSSGLDTNPVREATIYPNLVKAGQPFTVYLDGESPAVVTFFSVSGVQVSTQSITGAATELSIDRPGVYIARIKQGAKNTTSKIIVF